MYRFIIERSGKIVHLRGQKYPLLKKQKNRIIHNKLIIWKLEKTHDKKHLFFTNKIACKKMYFHSSQKRKYISDKTHLRLNQNVLAFELKRTCV